MAVVLSENAIFGCCASQRFASRLAASNPFPSISALVDEARRIWWHECGVLDWLQAFDAHPKIGEKKASSPDSTFAKFSSAEQSAAAQSTTADISAELAHWNKLYADKFGFIFIICARGRSAPEILVVLKERFNRLPHEELHAASGEQMKITEMRLQALCGDAPSSDAASRAQARAEKVLLQVVAAHASGPARSPITTHALDTALGSPAQGLPLKLMKFNPATRSYDTLASGVTNDDGRVPNLLPPGSVLEPGRYRMYFNTTEYLLACRKNHPTFFSEVPFYPEVTIDFQITGDKVHEHYHIPLLLSPYGFSTYRGS